MRGAAYRLVVSRVETWERPVATRLEVWERRNELPLLLLALAFIAAYAWPILDPRLDASLEAFFSVVSWTVWIAFTTDFAIRLYLARGRRAYLVAHWYDVALIAFPMLRPLRLLRAIVFARMVNRSVATTLVGRVTIYVAGTAAASSVLGALTVLDAERGDPRANITTFGDALWWACTTMSTVGYGDLYPVTLRGRLVAVVLMVVGLAVLGSVTAAVAAWLVANVERPQA